MSYRLPWKDKETNWVDEVEETIEENEKVNEDFYEAPEQAVNANLEVAPLASPHQIQRIRQELDELRRQADEAIAQIRAARASTEFTGQTETRAAPSKGQITITPWEHGSLGRTTSP